MSNWSAAEQMEAAHALVENYHRELAERVVDMREQGFKVLNRAKAGDRINRWEVEQTAPSAVVLTDTEAGAHGEDRSVALTDFGDRGLLLRLHAYYASTEKIECVLLSNDDPRYFMARAIVGPIPYVGGHEVMTETSLQALTEDGIPLNLPVCELFQEPLNTLENAIEQRKLWQHVTARMGSYAVSPPTERS